MRMQRYIFNVHELNQLLKRDLIIQSETLKKKYPQINLSIEEMLHYWYWNQFRITGTVLLKENSHPMERMGELVSFIKNNIHPAYGSLLYRMLSKNFFNASIEAEYFEIYERDLHIFFDYQEHNRELELRKKYKCTSFYPLVH